MEVKKLHGVAIPDVHPCSWATDIFRPEVCSASTADLIACGAWALWTGRNNRRHGRKVWEPGVAARFIATLLEELAGLKAMTQLARPRRMTGWKRPDLG